MSKNNYLRALKEIEGLSAQGIKPNYTSVAARLKVDRRRLKKLFMRMQGRGLKPKDYDSFQVANGRPSYLDKEHEELFQMVVKACDVMDDPLTEQAVADLLFRAAQHQAHKTGLRATRPCNKTIKKYQQRTGVPLRSVRNGEDIRSRKSKPEYLIGFFCKLEELILKLQLGPNQIWNADEVGIKIVDTKLRMATSRVNIRLQFKDLDHMTAMITSNASGLLAPTLLIYPPSTKNDGITAGFSGKNVLGAIQENAYMDTDIFRNWLYHFTAKAKGLYSNPI